MVVSMVDTDLRNTLSKIQSRYMDRSEYLKVSDYLNRQGDNVAGICQAGYTHNRYLIKWVGKDQLSARMLCKLSARM